MDKSIYELITHRVVAFLEQGKVPWHWPWRGNSRVPRNLITKRPYRGINVFLLHCMGYASPYWLTREQVNQLNGNVREGQKACLVVFRRAVERVDEDGEVIAISFLEYRNVFNVMQCERIGKHVPENRDNDKTPVEAAQAIVTGMPQQPMIEHGHDHEFYSPREDIVGMRLPEQFPSKGDYYEALFHELIHSTGHPRRLNRIGLRAKVAFGSENYHREELVAEMGAALLCGYAGIVDRIESSADYIQALLKRLKSDPRLVVQAAWKAQEAADFVLGERSQKCEVEP